MKVGRNLGLYLLYLKQIRTYVWLGLLAGLGAAASFVPLYNVLEMDFAWVLALAVGPAAGHVALGGTRRVVALTPTPSPMRILDSAWLASLVLLVPAVAAHALLGIGATVCAPLTGLAYLALCSLPSALLGASLGSALAATVRRPWLAGLLLLLVLLADTALVASRLIGQPPVVLFGNEFGFFPGSLYDFAQPWPSELLVLRLGALLTVALCGAALAARGRQRRRAGSALASLAVVSLLIGPCLANRSRADIQQALSAHVSTDHFELYLDSEIPEPAREALEQDHEYAFARHQYLLGFAPERKLASYVYASPLRRRELIGVARTSIARPWSGEMHLVFSRRFPQPILAHELAHLFSADIGDETTGLSGQGGLLPNMGLIEGLAVAAAWDESEYSPHAWSAALRELELAPPLERVMSVQGFWSAQPAQVYLSSGSFTAWLWQTRGFEPFRAAYRDADIAGAYDAPVADLVREWEEFLQGIAVDQRLRERARFRFTRPSIFQRTCARKVALLAEDAALAIKHKRLDEARALYEEALELDPDRVELMLRIGRVALRQGEASAARTWANESLAHPGANEPLKAAAQELLGDADWIMGDLERGIRYWMQAYSLPAGARQRRRVVIKARAARASAPRLVEYLSGTDKQTAKRLLDEAVAAESAPGLAHYLRGLFRLYHFRWAEAIADLEAAGDLTAVASEVERMRVLALADALVHDGAPDGAEPLYRKLMVHERRDGARAMLSDRIARCRFAAGEKQPFRDLLHPLGKQEINTEPISISVGSPPAFRRLESTQDYTEETLFDYIDGAAELYLKHGFQRAKVQQFAPKDPERQGNMTTEIFDMGTPAGAGGIKSESTCAEVQDGYGEDGGCRNGNVLAFRRGQYFVIVRVDPIDELTLKAQGYAAAYIDALLGAPPQLPEGNEP